MAPRTVYANLPDGLANLNLWDQSLADMGSLGVIPCTATGTNALVLTPIATLYPPNINNPPNANQCFSFVAPATSTGAVTIQISGVTSFLKLYRMDAVTQAAANDVLINVTYVVSFNSALNGAVGGFQIQSPISNEINPVITGATISASTITTSTYNGNTWTAGTGILTIAALKTLTANNSITIAGTDGKTATFSNSLTFAGTDGKSLTLTNGLTVSGNDGTVSFGAVSKTFSINNSLTVAGTDGTTLTFQGTDTYVGRATTDTLTNKTYDTAGIGNVFKINGVQITANTGTGSNVLATSPTLVTPTLGAATATSVTFSPSTGGIVGTATNDSASAGTVGEYVSSSVLTGSAVALTTATPANITSISLTAGDWDVWIQPFVQFSGTTNITIAEASISTTTSTLNVTPTTFSQWISPTTSGTVPGSVTNGFSLPGVRTRISIAATTTVYFVMQASFTVAACTAYGAIQARRVR